jgi:hypothetical protein
LPELAQLPPVNRIHLDNLSDAIGIMQHAVGQRPDPAHGYCTDDVARALRVDLLHQRELGWPAVATSAWRSFRFLDEALDRTTGRFRNFRLVDRSWVDAPGSEDCHGRAMLALGETMAMAPDSHLVASAERLFAEALPAADGLHALRARASVVLGCAAAMQAAPTRGTAMTLRRLAEELRSAFEPVAGSAWPWPESPVTYENALPARALLVAGRSLDSPPMVELGLEVLDWLIDIQTAPAGHLSPIGNHWWSQGGDRSRFDQQPIEATTLLLAAEAALALTGDDRYRVAMERAYAWFLGANDLGLAIADPARGAGCDGLTRTGVNTNQGAESTLMWLIALEHVRALRGERPTSQRPETRTLETQAERAASVA